MSENKKEETSYIKYLRAFNSIKLTGLGIVPHEQASEKDHLIFAIAANDAKMAPFPSLRTNKGLSDEISRCIII